MLIISKSLIVVVEW